MVLSLVVLLIPVAVIVAIFRFYGGESVNVVDSSAAFASARAASAFPVVQPAGLASGWRSVSAAYQPDAAGAVLRVGYLTPSGGPVQLIESNRPADTLIPAELGDRTQLAETVTEAGLRWQLLTVRNGEHALVSVEPARILIIVGGADVAELRSLAASLR